MFDLSSLFLLVLGRISLNARSPLPPTKKKKKKKGREKENKQTNTIGKNKSLTIFANLLCAGGTPSILSKAIYNSALSLLPTCTKPRDQPEMKV